MSDTTFRFQAPDYQVEIVPTPNKDAVDHVIVVDGRPLLKDRCPAVAQYFYLRLCYRYLKARMAKLNEHIP